MANNADTSDHVANVNSRPVDLRSHSRSKAAAHGATVADRATPWPCPVAGTKAWRDRGRG
jgi:hypothetical protein